MITVLLADDHAMVRDGLRYILDATGDIQIIALASNGKEAVAQALAHRPNIGVIDISMPVMDGIEATRQIMKACPETRIITLSMYHTGEYVQRAVRAGALGYVLKDAAGNELVEAVRSLYAGGTYFSPQVAKYYGG
jgi:DNA-binding NarL/FixJ family response regulator